MLHLIKRLCASAWEPPEFPYEVVRTKRRKSAAIKVVSGSVQFVVPKGLSERALQSLIERKSPWVREQLRQQAELPQLPVRKYVDGELFRYLGRQYRLRVVQVTKSEASGVKLKTGRLIAHVVQAGDVRSQLERWYHNHAERYLLERTVHYTAIMGVEPQQVVVKSYKARWGSCSSAGMISYNWRIIMAPRVVVDYLVVHELAHLLELNHSARFWRIVEQWMPAHREHKLWLKRNGRLLDLE